MLNSNGMFGASVTQLAEYLPFKQEVAGSNPAGCTTESKLLCFRRDLNAGACGEPQSAVSHARRGRDPMSGSESGL